MVSTLLIRLLNMGKLQFSFKSACCELVSCERHNNESRFFNGGT